MVLIGFFVQSIHILLTEHTMLLKLLVRWHPQMYTCKNMLKRCHIYTSTIIQYATCIGLARKKNIYTVFLAGK